MDPLTVLLAPTPALAEQIVAGDPNTICIETSYGDKVVQGRMATYDHHVGVWRKFPSPCNNPEIPVIEDKATIVFSHVDLDSVGGAARCMPNRTKLFGPGHSMFWKMAEFVDLNGPHKLQAFLTHIGSVSTRNDIFDSYNAYCAWSSKPENRSFFPRDEITNITEHVNSHLDALFNILNRRDSSMMAAGRAWFATQDGNRIDSYRNRHQVTAINGDTIYIGTYSSNGGFVNSYYDTPDGLVSVIVASYYKDDINGGAITVSFEDDTVIEKLGFNARDVVQRFWTETDSDGLPLAGGHDAIAGGPRDITYLPVEGQENADLIVETIATMSAEQNRGIPDEALYDGAY